MYLKKKNRYVAFDKMASLQGVFSPLTQCSTGQD